MFLQNLEKKNLSLHQNAGPGLNPDTWLSLTVELTYKSYTLKLHKECLHKKKGFYPYMIAPLRNYLIIFNLYLNANS